MGLGDVTVLPGSITGFLHSLEQIHLPSLCFVCISATQENSVPTSLVHSGSSV